MALLQRLKKLFVKQPKIKMVPMKIKEGATMQWHPNGHYVRTDE